MASKGQGECTCGASIGNEEETGAKLFDILDDD
jgi:hypothetical protein